jgi:hypothetical protein
MSDKPICPRCGAEMVGKVVDSHKNAGDGKPYYVRITLYDCEKCHIGTQDAGNSISASLRLGETG